MSNLNENKYLLALDVNTSAIGLVAYNLNEDDKPESILHLDCSVFGEPIADAKTGKLKKALRREKRLLRRQTDRRAQRLRKIAHLFSLAGTTSEKVYRVQGDSVYKYRSDAVTQKISVEQLMAVLLLIAKNRGYNGRFVTDDGKIKQKVEALQEKIKNSNCTTLGQYLYLQKQKAHQNNIIQSWKKVSKEGTGQERQDYSSAGTYAHREDLQNEINAIFDKQKEYHLWLENKCPQDIITKYFKENCKTILTDKIETIRDAFYHAIFDQRPICWDIQTIGECPLEIGEKRIAKAHPLFQEFRIEQFLNDLHWRKKKNSITSEEKEIIRKLLNSNKKISYSSVYKKLNIDNNDSFTHDRSKFVGEEQNVLGNVTKKVFEKLEKEIKVDLNEEERSLFIELVCDVSDVSVFSNENWDKQDILKGYLEGYSKENKDNVINFIEKLIQNSKLQNLSKMGFDNNRGRYSAKAINLLLQKMKATGCRVDEAVKDLYPDNKHKTNNDIAKIGDGVVQQALLETIKSIEYTIKKFGNPHKIVVELSRNMKLSQEKRNSLERENKNREKVRDEIKKELQKLSKSVSDKNIRKYLLWIQQNKCCVYCGQQLAVADVLNENNCDIDHILPKEMGGDSRQWNLCIAHKSCNQKKEKKLPLQAFLGEKANCIKKISEDMKKAEYLKKPYDERSYKQDMKKRADRLLLEELNDDEEFKIRQNSETSWIGRELLAWLKDRCNIDNKDRVYISKGQVTGYLRNQLGLNTVIPQIRKEEGKAIFNRNNEKMADNEWNDNLSDRSLQYDKRQDHRHHVVDAAVVGLVDRSLFKKATTYYKQHGGLKEFIDTIDFPIKNQIRDNLKQKLTNYIVWHKPDRHPIEGFFQDTLYKREKETNKLIIRKPLESLLDKDKDKFEKNLESIVGQKIKEHIKEQFNSRYEKFSNIENEKDRIRYALCGKDDNDGIVFPSNTKNKVKHIKCYYKERGYIEYKKEYDAKICYKDKNKKEHIQIYRNGGFACCEVDFNNKEYIFIPYWKYYTKKYQNKLKTNNITRLYKNDIIKVSNKYWVIQSFNVRDGLLCSLSTETKTFSELQKFKANLHKTFSRELISNIKLIKNRKELADNINRQESEFESDN